MKRFRVQLVAVVAMILCALLVPAAFAQNAELAKMQMQMLGVTVQLNENCSGTLISSERDKKSGEVTTLVLTAKHCVVDNKKTRQVVDVPVYQKNRIVKADRYYGTVLGMHYASDLALVQLLDKQTWFEHVAKIAPAEPDLMMGEATWTVGYPKGLPLTITTGLFTSYEMVTDSPVDGDDYIRATPDSTGGNSGGALWHKNAAGDYELLGVTSMGFRDVSYMGYYTPSNRIHEYLKVAAPAVVGAVPPASLPAKG